MDRLFSDDELDDVILGVDQIFEQGSLVAESEDSSVLPIDEEAVDFLVQNQAMTEAEARQYVHDTRHLMSSMGVADTTKIDFWWADF
jgi:hypothetical protein